MDQYAVIGNPVQHSKSPLIHRLFAEQTNQKISYIASLVDFAGLEKALKEFQSQGFKGLNVTLPFKHKVFGLIDTMSERAQRAEAVNMITFNEDGSLYGDNTDGVGLVQDLLCNKKIAIKNKRVLILGAGGAVRGTIEPILNEKPANVVIANRNESKAFALAEDFSDCGPIQACAMSLLESNSFDLVINGTSASLQDEMLDLPGSILRDNAFCYDMVYGRGATLFLRWAVEQGAKDWADGLGMLVEQAAESFSIWRNAKPNTQLVLSELTTISNQAEII